MLKDVFPFTFPFSSALCLPSSLPWLYHSTPLSQFPLLGQHNTNPEEKQLTKLQKIKWRACRVCSGMKNLALLQEAKKINPATYRASLRQGDFLNRATIAVCNVIQSSSIFSWIRCMGPGELTELLAATEEWSSSSLTLKCPALPAT